MDRFTHRIKHNHTTRIPRRHIFLDTEAYRHRVGTTETQTFRCAVAQLWAMPKGRPQTQRWVEFTDPDALWAEVDAHCRPRTRTVLWAHNLGYDSRVSECFVTLPALGWSLVAHNMQPRGTWLQWRKGDASLTMVDSASVFPITLARLGEHFGMGKPALPDDSADMLEWMRRCRGDVEILATAVKAYLAWLEAEDLGNWQHTGAGQSWSLFRHRFLTHSIVVHDDAQALAAERAAMYAGRCEALWHGTLRHDVVHEWDITLDYARIARDVAVPVSLVGPVPGGPSALRWLGHPQVALLAVCRITTDVPTVPTRMEDRILWPVGTFESTLWGPEIAAALSDGATVTVLEAWVYRTAPALAEWGEWIIEKMGEDDDQTPAWQKVVLKHHCRALVGRFGMTYTEWEAIGVGPDFRTERYDAYDAQTETESEMLQVGRDLFEKSGTVEWIHSAPAITGYVMSVGRVRLWRIMQAAPRHSILYADTDSIIVHERYHDAIKAIADSPIGHGLRLKKSWDGISVWGPRQIVTGPETRVAGLPKTARPAGPDTFAGEVWESLDASFRRRRPDRVTVSARTWRIHGRDARRTVGPGGWTLPREVG